MREFHIYEDTERTVEEFKRAFDCEIVNDNFLKFDNQYGKGEFVFYIDRNDTDLLFGKMDLKEMFLAHREPAKNKLWVLSLFLGELGSIDQYNDTLVNFNSQFTVNFHRFTLGNSVYFSPKGINFGGSIRFKDNFFDKNYSSVYDHFEFIDENASTTGFNQLMNVEIQEILKSAFIQNKNNPLFEFQLYNRGVEILNLFLINLWENHHKMVKSQVSDEEVVQLMKAEELFNDYFRPPTLKEISGHIGMGTTKANTLFKQVYGQTPYNYFNEKRMLEAYQMIKDKNFNIGEVGMRLGFANLSHFAREFKKRFGMLPKTLQMRSNQNRIYD